MAPAVEPLPLVARVATLTAVVLPSGGLVAAVALVWGWGFSWAHLGLLAGMYVLTALGVTVDASYYAIRLLALAGLAWKVRFPAPHLGGAGARE